MKSSTPPLPAKRTRRDFFATAGGAALALSTTALSAATTYPRTPRQSTGPFYPATLPLDMDNDLVRVKGKSGIARGVITHITGRVSDDRGRVLSDTRIEIWQCNAFGRYHHPRDRRDAPIDENFQGYGRITTGDDGLYRFRTIRPVHYPGRTPHIHFAVSGPGIETLITQMYVAGEARNASDGLLNGVYDARARARLIVELLPVPGTSDELMGRFDLVLAADGRFGRAQPGLIEGLLEANRRSV
jgi:protocatechuate 3,4-dioxygenase beta subunit